MRYAVIILLLVLSSCSAEKRLQKLLQHNPELERVDYSVDTLRVVDRIVNDSIVYRDSIVVRPVRIVETPPTRYEVRYRYRTDRQREKTIRDSLDAIVKQLRIEARKERKVQREETKRTRSDNKKEVKGNRLRFLYAVLCILGMVSILYFATRRRSSGKNGTFDETS